MRGWEAMSITLLGRLKNELGNRLEVTPSPKLQLCASHKCGSVRPLDCPPERRGGTGWVRRDLFPAAEPRPGCAARGSRMSPTPPHAGPCSRKQCQASRNTNGNAGQELAGPTDQPRTTRCLQHCSHEALWYSGGEEGEQDMCEPGQPAGGWKPGS